ncbi:pleckstrin homology domain-containing family A member 3 isoform X1 [Siniperca chuatsi]|uniref:pleckstrin homology domain-containing family A member 3 isoform X1 n=1 Tax=Siniperca chuatsi TaxID=119488 RepID=UPI001CE13ABC|nr:pleckstrin homology domain-containing family A member 3 isoform X1 [Siniperca chuatsi]
MEGILYKWTNYMTGWQPRWFVLENGVISYYDNEDDVGKGSKGSIKMSVCDIKVHPSDPTRLELIIPGEQHFYVRAVNAAERQRWLVALGSSKAGTLDSHKHRGRPVKTLLQLSSLLKINAWTSFSKSCCPDCLKTKMSELRLYCDLLFQQVQTIQSQHTADTEATPTSEASLLSATCATFIRTLEECMTLANQSLTPDLRPPERMKRSISHPGTYSFDKSGLLKEYLSGGQRSTQRRNRTCSDSSVYDTERVLPSLNGDSSSIPEERGGSVSPKTTPTDTDTDLSI